MRRRKVSDKLVLQLWQEGKTQAEIARALQVSHVAIHKRLKRLATPESLTMLTQKEQKFCLAVVEGKSRTQAALEAYDCASRASAKALQNTLMDAPRIQNAIDELLELKGYGRDFRTDKLGQHMAHPDPVVSLKALDMGFRLSNDYPDKNSNQGTSPAVTMNFVLSDYRTVHSDGTDEQ